MKKSVLYVVAYFCLVMAGAFTGNAIARTYIEDPDAYTIQLPPQPAPVVKVEVMPPDPVIVENPAPIIKEIPVLVEKIVEVEKVITLPAPDIQVHAEWELEVEHLWDVSPPTRIDIIMWPDSMTIYKQTAQERCEDMGGELIYYPKTQQFMCEDVDY